MMMNKDNLKLGAERLNISACINQIFDCIPSLQSRLPQAVK
jgi:hypothetical protein